MASLGRDSEQEMDTREPPLSVDRATRSFSYVTVFVPCDSLEATCKLSALPLQRWLTMKEHWAHGTHAQHSGDYCDTARQTGTGLGPDRPECWPTDDASDDLRTCVTGQETTDGVHATREKTPQNCLTPPSEVKNRQFYARKKKKRLRLMWLARSHRCSVNTHGKPVLIFLLANTTAEPK